MTIDTGPKCPKCGATVYALVEHHCKVDPDTMDAVVLEAVANWLADGGWLRPADAVRLRGLLRELVDNPYAGLRPRGEAGVFECVHCRATGWVRPEFPHTGDCPVRRAREAVGDEG